MTSRRRALAYLAASVYFAAALLAVRGHDAPKYVEAAAAWGMGASLALSTVCWGRGSTEPGAKRGADTRGV